jgi:signal transduction histidine kinase
MYDSPDERCWQVLALSRAMHDHLAPSVEIEECHECEVYRRCCPDKLTELGESFNNLMFLLEGEARQLGQMRAQMVEKEKMVAVGQMAAGIAHEVGNPLSSISSVVQMLKRGQLDVLQKDQLELIETHIQRITGTVRQLVSLARPGGAQWEWVSVGETLAEAVQLVGFDRRARNVEIDFTRPASLPRTYALRSELQQVFINLALNALDAMPNGGKLTIRAVKRRRDIVVSVEDTGGGIAPQMGRRVFEPFVSTKEPGQGTGLGLAGWAWRSVTESSRSTAARSTSTRRWGKARCLRYRYRS